MLEDKVDKNETGAFFALLRAGLWERSACMAVFGDISYGRIFQLSQSQTVVGIVAAGLEHIQDTKVPKGDLLNFAGSALQIEQRNEAMNLFVAGMVRKMKSAGIYTLLVKGQGVAQCYERPLWRTSGDVDFFLNGENYEKARKLLLPMASSTERYTHGNHLEMVIDSWVVELHGWLRGGISNKINKVLDDIQRETFYAGDVRGWDNDGVQVLMLGMENDAFYVFAHFVNHFYKGGIGLRQICDWCRLLWTFRDKLDLQKLKSRVEAAGLMTEWKAFGAFAVDYMGMPAEAMPYYSDEKKWKKKAKLICDFILETGNFGHNRDMSYYQKYPYLIRKCCSVTRRVSDLWNHAWIFPLDSFRFFPYVIYTGIRSVAKGA